jgi:hypothetical protein
MADSNRHPDLVRNAVLVTSAIAVLLCLNSCGTRSTSSPASPQVPILNVQSAAALPSAQPEVTFHVSSLGVLFFDCDRNLVEGAGFTSSSGQRIDIFGRSFVSRAAAANHLKCRMKNAQKIISQNSLYDDGGKIIGERIIISALDPEGFQATGREYIELMWTYDTSFHSVTGDSVKAVLAFEKWNAWVYRTPGNHI